jgi:two-component system chemotaxis sensor kinase CheA
VHLVRNAVDHGIEAPERRAAAGKPCAGTVLLAAAQAGDHILLTITDDGGGMDPEMLRRKVVEKGLLDTEAAARLTPQECYGLIFLPGFSTKAEISDVSGRGVGMDVVRTKIAQINGAIEIDSTVGRGTRIDIKVPLTLAIMPTLMVVVGDQIYALPLASVGEILDLDLGHVHVVDGQQMVMVRDRTLPVFHLRQWLVPAGAPAALPAQGHVVVAHAGNQRVGLLVDRLIGQEEVVIKPLGVGLHGTPGVAGATITGDGRIALILDLPILVRHHAGRDYRLHGGTRAADVREVA